MNAEKEAEAVRQAQNVVVDTKAALNEINKAEQDAKTQAEAAEAEAKAKEAAAQEE